MYTMDVDCWIDNAKNLSSNRSRKKMLKIVAWNPSCKLPQFVVFRNDKPIFAFLVSTNLVNTVMKSFAFLLLPAAVFSFGGLRVADTDPCTQFLTEEDCMERRKWRYILWMDLEKRPPIKKHVRKSYMPKWGCQPNFVWNWNLLRW